MTIGWWIAGVLLLAMIALSVQYWRLKQKLERQKAETDLLQERLADAEQELTDVKARRKKLLAASTQALIIVENDFTVSSANKVARRLFGKPEKGATLMSWTRQHQLQEVVAYTLDGEKMPPQYLNYNERALEVHARAIKENKEAVAVALAIHDVTKLQRLARARRDFVVNISHELRTPLASIQLLTDTLLNGGLDNPAMALDLTNKIAGQVDTLTQMAQEVLHLSLIESGKVPLKMANTPLQPILEAEVDRFTPQARRKKLTLTLTPVGDLSALVDDRMISRVISNLLHNAIKFTDQGGVTVSANKIKGNDSNDVPTGRWVKITVSDTGLGLSPEDLTRIFERFYKVDKARNCKEAGTGLGLSIARHIVEAHGGKIWAEQNNGPGASFHFIVPTE